jgi:hypothetical protein
MFVIEEDDLEHYCLNSQAELCNCPKQLSDDTAK